MKKKRLSQINYTSLIGAIALPLIVSIVGAAFTIPEIPGWYASLEKPFFNPPNWMFGPVWTLLYILQGIAFYLVVSAKARNIRRALLLFFVQLTLNLVWSILFFGLHDPQLALFEIILLWAAIIATAYEFSKHSKTAGWLMAPYAAWVTFALALNAAIVSLN